ncbi:hypothetical protein J0X15_14500 [Roseibium sp. CAU 1637]|uniref:Ornithine carbamoyltransferase n=1 Tax=Roseibium limicola TaxID=2816037 RepID=A0A939ER56_9HYPH|nr:hypothetical protein [Roseibium limicola]MBO0346441.1 hypothetical protein [Roseibium limicola]
MTRHLLSLDRLTSDELLQLADRAKTLSDLWAENRSPQSLTSKKVALIEDDSGWRNPSALDLGVHALGGLCTRVPVSLMGGEATEDLAAYLANWFDLIAIRTPQIRHLQKLADHSSIPVLNLRTRTNHPCETLGDLSYLRGARGSWEGLTIVAVAPVGNILNSWIEAARVLPIKVIQVYDYDYLLEPSSLIEDQIEATDSMSAIAEADVLITDCWPKDGNAELLRRYQVSAARLDEAKPGCTFIPCPPVTRGQEVKADAMLHPAYQSPAAKAYLLHAQNAYLEWALGDQTAD